MTSLLLKNLTQSTFVTTTYYGIFQIVHSVDIDIKNPRFYSDLTNYAKHFLELFGIYSHVSNWNTVKLQDLTVIISCLQKRRTPVLSLQTFQQLKSFTKSSFHPMVADGTTEPPIDPYIPNCVLIAPSSIPEAGIGVFARHNIPPEWYLGHYDGSFIGHEKDMKQIAEKENNPYVFSIYRLDTPSGRWVKGIDAQLIEDVYDRAGRRTKKRGSWHRYVNRSAESPNVEYRLETPSTKLDKSKYFIQMFSIKPIQAGTELVAQYFIDDAEIQSKENIGIRKVSKQKQSNTFQRQKKVTKLSILDENVM